MINGVGRVDIKDGERSKKNNEKADRADRVDMKNGEGRMKKKKKADKWGE